MIPPYLTFSNIRYVSRVKWRNPRKGVTPSPTPRCRSYWKGSPLVALDYGRQLYLYWTLAWWLECLPMARETWVQSQVESYQRLKKWYLMAPCLTLNNIRWGARVKWSNLGKGVAPSATPRCCSYREGSLRFTLD